MPSARSPPRMGTLAMDWLCSVPGTTPIPTKPAVVVLDSEGNEIFRKIGYFEPEVFIKKLEMARKKAAHRAAKALHIIQSNVN